MCIFIQVGCYIVYLHNVDIHMTFVNTRLGWKKVVMGLVLGVRRVVEFIEGSNEGTVKAQGR